jgi:hypothetical protein
MEIENNPHDAPVYGSATLFHGYIVLYNFTIAAINTVRAYFRPNVIATSVGYHNSHKVINIY